MNEANSEPAARACTAEVTSAFFSQDGKHILTAARDGTMRIYDFEVG